MSALALLAACSKPAAPTFVKVADGKFFIGDKPYSYVGTNFWYGAILGSQGEGGDRDRLSRELDTLRSLGINNLRILVGGDGPDGVPSRIEPTLQKEPGVYNDEVLDGLDWLLSKMGERSMYAILYMNNSWEWSGGYMQYLEWAGCGPAPLPSDGRPAFYEYVRKYAFNEDAHKLFSQHVEHIVTRTNRYTGLKYIDDPAIMAWQIGNEPRAFSNEGKEPFARWVSAAAAQIKSLDPNHLVSVGSEGKAGSENDMSLFEKVHADPNIDYMTMHIWPLNWRWITTETIDTKLDTAIVKTRAYIDEHLTVAKRHNKPIVIEEFGYPRDGYLFTPGSPTPSRDGYYESVFDYIREHMESGGALAGCNFWSWSGYAEVSGDHIYWQKGDDYTGDPAQEQQGLYSVFLVDTTTMGVIRKYTELLSR